MVMFTYNTRRIITINTECFLALSLIKALLVEILSRGAFIPLNAVMTNKDGISNLSMHHEPTQKPSRFCFCFDVLIVFIQGMQCRQMQWGK